MNNLFDLNFRPASGGPILGQAPTTPEISETTDSENDTETQDTTETTDTPEAPEITQTPDTTDTTDTTDTDTETQDTTETQETPDTTDTTDTETSETTDTENDTAKISEITDSEITTMPDYSDGLMSTTKDGTSFLKAEFVGITAEIVAASLTTGKIKITAAAFHSAFLRDAKKHLRRGIPYEARATCAAEMVPQAIKLVAKKKAPPMLRDLITAAVATVHDDATFEALYKHLEAVYCYLLDLEGGDTV